MLRRSARSSDLDSIFDNPEIVSSKLSGYKTFRGRMRRQHNYCKCYIEKMPTFEWATLSYRLAAREEVHLGRLFPGGRRVGIRIWIIYLDAAIDAVSSPLPRSSEVLVVWEDSLTRYSPYDESGEFRESPLPHRDQRSCGERQMLGTRRVNCPHLSSKRE